MIIEFSKYQGTGNDFVLLNNLDGRYDDLSIGQIQLLCDRRFGVGADGLIKINSSADTAFEVDYYNSDGSKSFCGNGARCAVSFAGKIGLDVSETLFDAFDGLHKAAFDNEEVSLEMTDVNAVEEYGEDYVLYTGSPHYVRFVKGLDLIDVVETGKSIRYSERFNVEGINVNVAEVKADKSLAVLTYERGVEDETLSCGTGVTAVTLAYAYQQEMIGKHTVDVKVKGGALKVAFNQTAKGVFCDIQLIGPAVFVYSGEINV